MTVPLNMEHRMLKSFAGLETYTINEGQVLFLHVKLNSSFISLSFSRHYKTIFGSPSIFIKKSSHFLQIQSPSYYQINVMAKSIFHPRMLGYTGGDYTVESHFGQVSDVFGMDEVQCTGNEDYIWRCPHESTDDCSGGEGFGVICYNGGRNFLLNTSQITRQPDHKMIFLSTKSEQNFNV